MHVYLYRKHAQAFDSLQTTDLNRKLNTKYEIMKGFSGQLHNVAKSPLKINQSIVSDISSTTDE